MARYDIRAVANEVLLEAQRKNIAVTHLSLQKVCFFVHGIYLANRHEELVQGEFEAWKFGPVHRVLFHALQGRKDHAIEELMSRIDPISGEKKGVLRVSKSEDQKFISETASFFLSFTAGLYDFDLGLFVDRKASWKRVVEQIVRDAKPDFLSSCIEVADLIWKLNDARDAVAKAFDAPPFFIGPNQPVPFGIRHVCRVSGKLLFPFVQMRRAHGLDIKGLGILASMIREAYVFGDYASAGVEVIDLSVPKGMKNRQVRTYYGSDLPYFSLDELNEMASEVYAIVEELAREDE